MAFFITLIKRTIVRCLRLGLRVRNTLEVRILRISLEVHIRIIAKRSEIVYIIVTINFILLFKSIKIIKYFILLGFLNSIELTKPYTFLPISLILLLKFSKISKMTLPFLIFTISNIFLHNRWHFECKWIFLFLFYYNLRHLNNKLICFFLQIGLIY